MKSVGSYKPEYLLSEDAFVGEKKRVFFESKLDYLVKIVKEEQWDFKNPKYKTGRKYPILNNYLFFTYDRLKEENKIAISDDNKIMCFNTGLQTRDYEEDVYAVFEPNSTRPSNSHQIWKFLKFSKPNDIILSSFKELPQIAEYWDDPADLLFDKRLEVRINYKHIVEDNMERFKDIGLNQPINFLEALLKVQADKAIEKVKRNYKVAIPQFYADKDKTESRIQLLLPLCFHDMTKADLALVISKEGATYIGKTILPLDWAYMNSRRIITPDADWIINI